MRKINFKSDFDFVLRLADPGGNEIDILQGDITARLFTVDDANCFVASRINGKCNHCFVDGGRLHIVCDNHGLWTGALKVEIALDIADPVYPDGIRHLVSIRPTDIELVNGPGDSAGEAVIDLRLPLVKGDPFTFDDFTPDQLEMLRRPAEEAAEECRGMVDDCLSEVAGQIEGLAAEAGRRLFADQWCTACGSFGTYNADSGFFELNGITDISYEQALAMMQYHSRLFTADCSYKYLYYSYEAILPVISTVEKYINADRMFCYAKKLKRIAFVDYQQRPSVCAVDKSTAMFHSCLELEEIQGQLQFKTAVDSSVFARCEKLHQVRVHKLLANINFGQSPLLSLESFQYMIAHAVNTSAITITVHPDVMAKLTADTTNAAAAALTAKQLALWTALVEAAAEKQIQFATI